MYMVMAMRTQECDVARICIVAAARSAYLFVAVAPAQRLIVAEWFDHNPPAALTAHLFTRIHDQQTPPTCCGMLAILSRFLARARLRLRQALAIF